MLLMLEYLLTFCLSSCRLRYPKVGTTNPTVQFNILDLSTEKYEEIPITAFSANDTVVGEVAWMTDEHSAVIYRAYNRVQDQDKHVLVDPVAKTSKIVRERDGTDGWLDNTLSMSYIGAVNSTNSSSGGSTYSNSSNTNDWYVDVSDESGWNHIYLFPTSGGEATALTRGEWEVVAILKIDSSRNLIYFTSTEHHSTERHVYSVNYATGEKKAIVDDTVDAYWSASFSSGGDYYILSYLGTPIQKYYSLNIKTN